MGGVGRGGGGQILILTLVYFSTWYMYLESESETCPLHVLKQFDIFGELFSNS